MESYYYRILASAIAVLVVLGAAGKVHSVCNVSLEDLEKCLPAAHPPNPPPPTPDCCNTLARANLPCLCGYKNDPVLPAVGVDPNLALQLPGKCNLPTPQC
ncbi:putative lipid-transfer protein DIR1 [Andrographis paniculata]|uniref:putative lipid-transfer protein DIR1 n=1 Tax=Andrographis paniculata TaxID=175694 RepID=UPI0021E6EE5C|nr:putative lipid-transfer protein DIR1 [Andrographis paniculata]